MYIVGLLLALLFLVLSWGVSKQFRDETGVAPPSRSAYRALKRRAKNKGISMEAALDQWIENKKKRV